MRPTRRELAVLAAAGLVAPDAARAARRRAPRIDYKREAALVRREIAEAWAAHVAVGIGNDELRPVSRTAVAFFAPGRPVGLTAVEALDTLALASLPVQRDQALDWVQRDFDPRPALEVGTFEATIRLLGGLVGGFLALGRPILLDHARAFADGLLPAYERSPTGLPYGFVDMRTGAVRKPEVGVAECGTGAAELARLSALTGDPRYAAAGRRALDALWARRLETGLPGTSIHVETGRWLDTAATPGPPVDSYFETLFDASRVLGDGELRARCDASLDALLRTAESGSGRLAFPTVDGRTGRVVGRSTSALTAFLPGLLAQADRRVAGRQALQPFTDLVVAHGQIPETFEQGSTRITDGKALLRPEYLDACLHLYWATRDDRYRRLGLAFHRKTRELSKGGGTFTVLDELGAPSRRGDLLPSWWFAETAKYLLLLLGGRAPRLLSTEGHLL